MLNLFAWLKSRNEAARLAILGLSAIPIKKYHATFAPALTLCSQKTPDMLVCNHVCRQILYCRVCQSGQATPSQNRFQRLVNFRIAIGAGERRDYAHAPVAPRQGSSRARLFVHAAISRAKRGT